MVMQLQPQAGPPQQVNQYNPELDPQTGETPISGLPQYGGAGGGTEAQSYYAARDFYQMFGRNPTQSELAMLSGAYASGDANKANTSGGKQAVAQYYQSLTNTPANLYARQQKQWGQAAPQHYDAVNQMFQSTYGRAPTQDELSHYGTLLASGQADQYQLGQFLQSLPEYQNSQDAKFRSGLDNELQGSDEAFFNRVSPQISQRYAMMGRATSPALAVAMTDLAAQLSEKRQGYLAQLSASQYGGNKSAAMDQYNQSRNQIEGNIYGNAQAQYNNILGVQKRTQDISDYALQNQNYMNALGASQHAPGALDYLNTAFHGAEAGAKVYSAGK